METFAVPDINVLCVDSDPAALQAYTDHFEKSGYCLHTAGSAGEGIDKARKVSPDIIISAVILSDMDGFDFCDTIKTQTHLISSKILLIFDSASAATDKARGIEIGADDFLHKPVQKEELLAKVKAFSRLKRLQDDLVGTNRKLEKALRKLKDYKKALESKNSELADEKRMLEHSMKQASLMAEQRQKANNELEALIKKQKEDFYSLISILSSAVESKRRYHVGHSRRVADIAVFIARKMELPKPAVRTIKIAALLHEIGKLSFPDELLEKSPEAFTQKEKTAMMHHPVKGSALLEKFSGFQEVADIIKHFHEKVDGSGSPDGLRGEQIPLGSRIIAAANVFENLVFRKEELTTEQVFEGLEAEIGIRFDPHVVHCLHAYAREHPTGDVFSTQEVRVDHIEQGMVLASGIFTLSGAKLLPAGTVITEKIIEQIDRYRQKEPLKGTVFVKN
ncbi:MAG: HD domain-containing protein [Thermodesulfobacteriota bacterium]|nr:HD domain-containing protein [Thermodesulfobacteriota bacterium]